VTELPFLPTLTLVVIAAAGMLTLARRLRLPSIVAFIAAGLLLGPVTEVLHGAEAVDLLSEVGIALLLFLVGMELQLSRVRDVLRLAVVGGVAQLAVTGAFAFGLARLLGFPAFEAVVLGLAIALSSTVAAIKGLDERRELGARHGRAAIGVLLVQDVAVALALAVLAGMAREQALGGGQLAERALRALAGTVVLGGAALAGGRYLLPPLFRWLGAGYDAVFAWSLLWCFAVILLARAFQLPPEVGAFLAGVALAQHRASAELHRRVQPLVHFFLAVFFVTLGIELRIGAVEGHWGAVVAFTAFVLLLKPAIIWLILPRLGAGPRTTFLTGVTLGQTSEFSFILLAAAAEAGRASGDAVAVLGVVGLVTISISALALQAADPLFTLAGRLGLPAWLGEPAADEPAPAGPGRRDHIIIVGVNTLGVRLVEAFLERGERVLAIDTDASKLEGLPCDSVQGSTDHEAVLREAGFDRARLVVSTLQIEEANNLLAYRAQRAGVRASLHAFEPALAAELREYGATHVMVSKYDGIRQMLAALRQSLERA
jgi:Kef-type K+ transport system membrane component KefB